LAPPQRSNGGAPRVLVVDDEEWAAKEVSEILARLLPCKAEATTNPAEACGNARSYDLIVTDLVMPGRDGLALLAEIKTLAPTCEVVVVTVAPQVSTAIAAMRLGAVDYVKREAGEEWLAVLVASARHALRRRPSLRAPGYHREHILEFFFDRIATRVKVGVAGQFPPGVALEYLVKLLLDSCTGFNASLMRHKTIDEELDVVCLNNSSHPFWVKQETVIVVECKDRGSRRPGANERGRLEQKIRNREGRATAGIFVSTNGFASTFHVRRIATPVPGGPPPLIIPIDETELSDWVDAPDRLEWLSSRAIAEVLT
jgi:CheY-like chemotaxis protein